VEATIKWRRANGEEEEAPLGSASLRVLQQAAPWRVLRQHKGQAHLSGLYWSSTMRAHVAYESRLELARLLLADQDRSVVFVSSQPFLIEAIVDGKVRRHVPDFLLVLSNGVVRVVNVKPAHRLTDPKVAAALSWANEAFESRGWQTEVWTGGDQTVVENVRFLSGYRRAIVIDEALIPDVLDAACSLRTVGDIESRLGAPTARPVVLHLLWEGRLVADLSTPLSPETRVAVAA
jgi:phytoene dehydrogenase-like protein